MMIGSAVPRRNVDFAFVAAAAMFGMIGCASTPPLGGGGVSVRTADPQASSRTRALFTNLRAISDDHVLFGHHDALAYGLTWSDEPGRSDVKEASGSYPALFGYDVSRLFRGRGSDDERRRDLRQWMIEGYERGGDSTDTFDSKEEYLDRYPGDDYIGVLGFDDYHSVTSLERQDEFVSRLRMLVEMAEARWKLAALTETGVETIPDSTWWTRVLLDGIENDPVARRIAYLMVWRNAHDRDDHFYAPYLGHPSVPDFIRFRDDPFVLFEEELPDLYSQ